jgi:hypothetical protein
MMTTMCGLAFFQIWMMLLSQTDREWASYSRKGLKHQDTKIFLNEIQRRAMLKGIDMIIVAYEKK